MLNTQFFKPRNMAVIAAFTIVAAMVSKPLLRKINGTVEE